MDLSHSQAQRPPATPVYVLRGHAAAVHAIHFYSDNVRLASGDADGWVIIWDITTKRPVAAWKAHEGAILNLKSVDSLPNTESRDEKDEMSKTQEKKIFTHGRDNYLRVWRLNSDDEEILDNRLPVEENSTSDNRAEPWLIYSVTVNALNFCGFAITTRPSLSHAAKTASSVCETFIAVPNALDTGGIDIFHLPTQKRVCILHADRAINTGMVMALQLFFSPNADLYIVSGYEDGHAMVHVQRGPIIITEDTVDSTVSTLTWNWEKVYSSRAHSQPILSLDIFPTDKKYFLTSSADAIIAKHPIPVEIGDSNLKNDAPVRVVNTKHAGQQGLTIRSDERILVTAGWDNRARVYSCKSLKELAVLKWHKEGCYAVSLAYVEPDIKSMRPPVDSTVASPVKKEPESIALTLKSSPGSLAGIKQQRHREATLTHWVAVGSKDGKISLWDIY
ncbi:Astra associated protein 1 Asa1 [Ophidiomyces ophidiicola]|nr:Astra associated protein 1 Asa1 [Ophidiomyces ophidiicola]KAI1928635.1 Astra associated protein 1 Asa1 [Ophidiomyces ophidiicola]KAI1966263.1 Astra associated protein 1 Asa1 [Ophidiomyces ophidiicola]KAI1976382.1 Astra associated protein 1 Asa1 [Ophidiomyces ophidiicola]KAI2009657.1 Astra associated protein 1 Asa1 [Ophidiomyces ophidiicola]